MAPGGARGPDVRRSARRGARRLSRAARRPAEVVLFDLDGVLADSRLAITSCVNHALAAHGREPVAPEVLYPLIGPALSYGFASLLDVEPDDPAVAACIASYREVYAEVSLRDTPTYPGVPEALEAIARVPGRRLAVATSKPRAFAEPLLRALGLRDLFEVVAAPELDLHVECKSVTVSAALEALAWGGAVPAAMVGDRHVDMDAAHAHGLCAVGVTWGFGTAEELLAAGADVLVASPVELPAAV